LGAVVTPMLMAAGHEVVGLDTGLFEQCTFGPTLPIGRTVWKDLRDIEADDIAGFDAIVHLAALSNDPLGDLTPAVTYAINLTASVRLAALARQMGVRRFVFSSSCSSYGAAGDDLVTEEAELRPITPYAASKVGVERDVARLANGHFSPTF